MVTGKAVSFRYKVFANGCLVCELDRQPVERSSGNGPANIEKIGLQKGKIFIASGSPNRALYSRSRSPRPVIMNPAYMTPL